MEGGGTKSRDGTMELGNECPGRNRTLGYAVFLISAIFSLVKCSVGILGSSEALAADGLYTFFQCFIVIGILNCGKEGPKWSTTHRYLWYVALIVSKLMLIGAGDIAIFSFVRMGRVSRGMLVRPSPYALYVALLSVLVYGFLYGYCRSVRRESEAGVFERPEWYDCLRLSVVISLVAVIGIAAARTVTLYGDAVSALVILALILPMGIRSFWRSVRVVANMVFYGKNADWDERSMEFVWRPLGGYERG